MGLLEQKTGQQYPPPSFFRQATRQVSSPTRRSPLTAATPPLWTCRE